MESGISELRAAEARPRVQSYEDLDCFQRSLALVRPVHDLVLTFPEFERFDLVQQMRRASKSVPTNIAEGFARQTSPKDYRLYLSHSVGSANEMLVHLQIAVNLDYASATAVAPLREEYSIVARQLKRLISTWK